MEFLSKLDPNLVAVLFTVVTTVGGWIYHKAKGDKQESIQDALWHILEGNAMKLAESDTAVEVVRMKLKSAAQEGLERLGLKRNAVTDMIIAKLVERGVTEVRAQIRERKNAEAAAALPAQLQALLALAEKLPKSFDPPANPTVPPLGIDIEIVKPEQ